MPSIAEEGNPAYLLAKIGIDPTMEVYCHMEGEHNMIFGGKNGPLEGVQAEHIEKLGRMGRVKATIKDLATMVDYVDDEAHGKNELISIPDKICTMQDDLKEQNLLLADALGDVKKQNILLSAALVAACSLFAITLTLVIKQ